MRLDHTLVRIRERSFLEIMDLGLVVVRRRPRPIVLAALLGIAPWASLNAWLTWGAGEDWALLNLLLIALETPFATAPLTILLGGMMFGSRPSARQIIGIYIRSVVPMFLYGGLLRCLLVCTVLLGWLVPLKLPFVNEVVLLERGPLTKVYSRCSDLTSDRGGELFSQWIAMLFFGSMFTLSTWVAMEFARAIVGNDLTWESPAWEQFLGQRALAAVWVAVAFFAVVRFLTYIDQRIRLEGWEVELRLRGAGAVLRKELEA